MGHTIYHITSQYINNWVTESAAQSNPHIPETDNLAWFFPELNRKVLSTKILRWPTGPIDHIEALAKSESSLQYCGWFKAVAALYFSYRAWLLLQLLPPPNYWLLPYLVPTTAPKFAVSMMTAKWFCNLIRQCSKVMNFGCLLSKSVKVPCIFWSCIVIVSET